MSASGRKRAARSLPFAARCLGRRRRPRFELRNPKQIRQADEGLSIIVDGYGRTLASGEGLADSGNYLLAEVPMSSPSTLYPVVGDVVGLISVVGLLALVAYALISGRSQQREDQQTAVITS